MADSPHAKPVPDQGRKADGDMVDDGNSFPLASKERSGKLPEKRASVSKPPSPISELLHFESDPFSGDQFKTIRTCLYYPPNGAQLRSVCISSPSMGEGKTYVCSRLGFSMAQNVDDKRVVLVDADIRRANLHQVFGYSEKMPGLSDYLLGHCSLESVLLKPFNENLLLLPGGSRPPNPSELLSSKKMLDLLKELHSSFDNRYVLIDLPSPKLVPETGVIARKTDGVIFVARAGKTPSDQVAQMIDWIGRERVVGVVLNRFDTSLHSSLYRMYRRFVRRK
ncbi:MAG: CpsD/CapB family tyrosine-protein kinase [Desulfococcaceae bacterium]